MTAFIQPLELDQMNASRGISKSWGLNATKEVGFHDPTGKRGVTGVIANDYMNGVIKNPERYSAKFSISSDEPPTQFRLTREEHEPPIKCAQLTFSEYVLHQYRSTLKIEFYSSNFEDLTHYIRKQYNETRFQTIQARMKLESILKLVSRRNTALYGMLQKPRAKKEVPLGSVSDSQFGYNWTRPMPRPELEKRESQGMLPQRGVVMKIPIATMERQHYRQKSYSHKERDPWIQIKSSETLSPAKRNPSPQRNLAKSFTFYPKEQLSIEVDHNLRESSFMR
jgi:hypothetical protein